MSRICTSAFLIQAVALISAFIGCATAKRSLLQAATCGSFVGGTDLPGENLDGSGDPTVDNDACLAKCTGDCTAVIRKNVNNGACWLKAVNPDTVVPTSRAGFTSYIVCADDSGPVDPTPAPAAAPAPAPTTPTPPAGGDLAEFFALEGCPNITPKLSASQHPGTLGINNQLLPFYTGPDPVQELLPNGRLALAYPDLAFGGDFCYDGDANGVPVLVGGTVTFKSGNQCLPFPTATGGGSCCTLWSWQPDNAGFYKSPCTMKQEIGADGVFAFRSEVPGDEDAAGWGPDPAPHYHFDIDCQGCDPNSSVGTNQRWANKFYVDFVCTTCGATNAAHLAEEGTFEGETSHKYQIVIDADA